MSTPISTPYVNVTAGSMGRARPDARRRLSGRCFRCQRNTPSPARPGGAPTRRPLKMLAVGKVPGSDAAFAGFSISSAEFVVWEAKRAVLGCAHEPERPGNAHVTRLSALVVVPAGQPVLCDLHLPRGVTP